MSRKPKSNLKVTEELRFLFLIALLLAPPIAKGGETYTLFTWIPGWEQKSALERSQSNTGIEAWQAALTPGTYEVAVEPSEITAQQIKLTDIPAHLERLPDGTKVIWHVGWWHNEDGNPVASIFAVPSNEHKLVIEEAARKAKIILEYAKGEV